TDNAIPEKMVSFGRRRVTTVNPVLSRHAYTVQINFTYPSQPRAALRPESEAPSGLERLEELIRLEEGGDPPRIDKTDDDNVAQEVGPLPCIAGRGGCGHGRR